MSKAIPLTPTLRVKLHNIIIHNSRSFIDNPMLKGPPAKTRMFGLRELPVGADPNAIFYLFRGGESGGGSEKVE